MLPALTPELQSVYEELLSLDVLRRIPGSSVTPPKPSKPERFFLLLSQASQLAMGDELNERTIAYEVATRLSALMGSEYPSLLRAAELILVRMGNFPGRNLLIQRFGKQKNDVFLHLEMKVREIENTIIDAGGRSRRLTDFQFDALKAFSKNNAVSLSAPTSAGKSFLLTLEALRKLSIRKPASIAYIVPTIALIRQVIIDVRAALAGCSLPFPIVRSLPRSLSPEEAPNGVIYVLTQERFLSMLASQDKTAWLTDLIVDEAQEVGSGSRGILLQTAVERFLVRFPDASVIFASPLAKNPEELLDLFKCREGRPFSERLSPVSQNIVLVESIQEHPYRARFTLLAHEKRIAIGDIDLAYRFVGGSALRRLAQFSKALLEKDTPEASCIIYANGAKSAERIAGHLALLAKKTQLPDPEIEDFIQFLHDHIHPEYELSKVLRFGVAFHYSNMPSAVRTGIEDLFKAGKIRYLCCTSTLLQGINLPARHLVVEAPERGDDKPMTRSDFLNLAGRAGRLKWEFHGNVWCLMPNRWSHRCFEGEPLHMIRGSFDSVMEDGGLAIRSILGGDIMAKQLDASVASLGRAFTILFQSGKGFDLEKIRDVESFNLTLEALRSLEERISLPKDLISKNAGIHPERLQALYDHFQRSQSLDAFCPIYPFSPGVNQNLREIFRLVQHYLCGVQNGSYKQHAKIASGWIHQDSLKEIIGNEVSYRRDQALKDNKRFKVQQVIYNVVDTIERELRFRYVRSLRAYHDLLVYAFEARGQPGKELPPLHLYLECGASKPVVLSLLSMGFSRTTALLLAKRVVLPLDATPEFCLRRCRETIANAAGLKLPGIVMREINSFVGGS